MRATLWFCSEERDNDGTSVAGISRVTTQLVEYPVTSEEVVVLRSKEIFFGGDKLFHGLDSE